MGAPPTVERILSNDAFGENTYVLTDGSTGNCIIIDPGASAAEVVSLVKQHDRRVTSILATHGHIDHVASATTLVRQFGAPFLIHRADEPLLDSLADQAAMFGYRAVGPVKADGFLKEGDVVELGSLSVRVWHTPGHTPGSSCFLVDDELAFTGDTLFAGSIGRTDFEGGSYSQMMASLARLMGLPGATRIYPGHEGESTIETERSSNPFIVP